MITVTAKEFRTKLSQYLDQLENGEEITIIRHSHIIGTLVPVKSRAKPAAQPAQDGGVKFRRFGPHEDPQPLRELQDPGQDRDLDGPASYYDAMGGEFWVGELDGKLVAMGGFRSNLGPYAWEQEAELRRISVAPDAYKGIDVQLLELLEERAHQANYKTAVLDVTDDESQKNTRHLYESHGYQETGRAPDGPHTNIYYRKVL